jgi:cytochrome d ubiquinol oxidase subunit I
MVLDTLLLSRIQFGFTIGFHILFPTFNLGLALFLTIMEASYIKTRKEIYLNICKFWTKIFALTFGMGVVSGIVLSYELGTNFGGFITAVGNVLGSLFAYEVLSAFFLEAGFLGVMLFGWNKVGPKLHFTATLLVMIGTAISAFWIMSANSWMQTPAGYILINGKFIVSNWWQVIFNPSFIPRFIHMLFAAYVTTTFVIAGVSAWYLLKKQHTEIAKTCFSFALGSALILTPLQIGIGDRVGLKDLNYQPLKTAAMEGLWDTTKGAPLLLFAIPNQAQQRNYLELKIPKLASLINTHQLNGELLGLKSASPADQPIVSTVFYSFRIMVGLGFLFFGVALYALWLRIKKQLFNRPLFYRLCILISPLGFISSIAGWLVAETGRQPWIVYGMLRTANGVSHVPMHQVLFSLSMFIVVYALVFSFYLFFYLNYFKKGLK